MTLLDKKRAAQHRDTYPVTVSRGKHHRNCVLSLTYGNCRYVKRRKRKENSWGVRWLFCSV